MKKRFSKVLTTGAIALSLFGGAVAYAATVNVGGGVWNYGKSGGYAYSNYFHGSRTHSSAVKVGNATNHSGWVGKGSWSYASIPTSITQVEQFYYNYK